MLWHGCSTPFARLDIREKIKKINVDKYGVEYPLQSKEVRNKINSNNLSHYGNKSALHDCGKTEFKDKAIFQERYGRNFNNSYYNYYGAYFDSSWELAVWIYCIDHNIPIIREPCIFQYNYDNKTHSYIPDFWIQGIGLVEIKGDQFFKDDGAMYFPYNGRHHNSIEFTKEEKEYYDNLYERKRKCCINNGIKLWSEKECEPYLNYCKIKYNDTRIRRWYCEFKIDNPYNPSYYINNTYIPNYYNNSNYIKGKGISPYDIDNNSEYTIIK